MLFLVSHRSDYNDRRRCGQAWCGGLHFLFKESLDSRNHALHDRRYTMGPYIGAQEERRKKKILNEEKKIENLGGEAMGKCQDALGLLAYGQK